ncbi:hypothetical protein [Cellulosimicrobium sp. TH-20]|uniref:hypothetical protein n=1 Tax=Cellulosimicrobium sp. TH-20 TaxID=1980001 RepID=UPI0011A6E154|nr:hypothetical protein [Cellulosimicrobium sp. TH-20]
MSGRRPLAARCRKRRYVDEVAARLTLATIHRVDSSRRPTIETRPYFCPRCRGWHLTSEPERTPAAA